MTESWSIEWAAVGEWWRGAVIYQIYPRSFQDSNGDGIGDLRGVRARLRHVAGLGADAIWIAPFFPSPQHDFGYDVSDYTGVDPQFGTLEDFDAVVAEAHRLGLRVLIDQVWSHSSDAHPWFADSRARRFGRDDWYIWVDPRPDGGPPNNWLGVFGGSAWTWEPRRRQYYLHHFLPQQPKLNLAHPDVLDAVLNAGRFWLDRGVDGFRLDALDFMAHDPALTDNPARPLAEVPSKPFAMQDHLHDMAGPQTVEVLAAIRGLLNTYPGTVAMAEVGSQMTRIPPLARAGQYTDAQAGPMHMAYSLRMMKQPGDAASLAAFIREAEDEAGQGWLVWAFSNHDVARVATRWGNGDRRAAQCYMALLLCLRGSVCLYQGEELGLPEADVPFDRLQDPFGLTFWPEFAGRDGCRTPMPWTPEAPAGNTWLPLPSEHLGLSVAVQEADAGSMLNTTRALLAWRKTSPALRTGSLTLRPADAPLLAFERVEGDERLLCVFNLGPDPVSVPWTDGVPAPVPGFPVPEEGRLAAWSAAVYRLQQFMNIPRLSRVVSERVDHAV
ncbi:MAG: alpha-amylase family glycosyl hydrolase [Rhodospirillaceae bacterium]